MTIANFITYVILIFGFIICFNKPKTAFLLLMATMFTRITIPLGVPRLASPLFIELILLLIIKKPAGIEVERVPLQALTVSSCAAHAHKVPRTAASRACRARLAAGRNS